VLIFIGFWRSGRLSPSLRQVACNPLICQNPLALQGVLIFVWYKAKYKSRYKPMRRKGGAAEGDRMPQFMFKTRSGTGYIFRRGVPEDVRRSIGKREFKKQLGGDYKAACRVTSRHHWHYLARCLAPRPRVA
jgi:hypothetical protein